MKSEQPESKPAERLDMVGWYDPGQLIRTGIEVAISTLFGRHSDYRLTEALTTGGDRQPSDKPYYDHTFHYKVDGEHYVPDPDRQCDELWIDYVGDVGDGWDSTYSVAHYLSRPELTFDTSTQSGDRVEHKTMRGNVLVFGGDQVYPTASRTEYDRRLIAPYETALRTTQPPHPHMYALPGNHDWYDSLVAFTRLFCSSRWFAGWRTQQTRSYFALKLPHGWWLVGTDVQLASDIDAAQVEYFRKVASQMQPGDRVILCNAEPNWIHAKIYGELDSDYTENNLTFLEENILKDKVAIFLAGDLHHYRRHATDDGKQKITAGGGGAFLHPTHGADVNELAGGYKLEESFPTPAVSRRLGWRNLNFLVLNPKFGLMTGVLYMLTAWTVAVNDIDHLGSTMPGKGVWSILHSLPLNPLAVFWILAIFTGFMLFTDTHSKSYRAIAGPLHGLAHILVAFLLAVFASHLGVTLWGLHQHLTAKILLTAAVAFAGGWIIGSCIMGVYLFVSLNIFGRHSNEAFSSLAIPDWKNFMRMHIDGNGDLTIYPVGIQRVPRDWKEAADGNAATLIPDDEKATAPVLIEPPIRVSRRGN